MGGEQAAGVLVTVKEEQLKAAGRKASGNELAELRENILKKYETEGSAYFSTARLWDDGIIDPVDTRKIIGLGIAVSRNKKYEPTKYGVFRM
jgi:acetyl-CoA carboxylase carboxyltransferase component